MHLGAAEGEKTRPEWSLTKIHERAISGSGSAGNVGGSKKSAENSLMSAVSVPIRPRERHGRVTSAKHV